MHLDPLLPLLVSAATLILLLGFLLRSVKQPALVGYLLAGVLLGPGVLGVFTDVEILTRVGDFGVILLLLFVGMEISLPRLLARWRIAVLGTLFQILVSIGCAWLIGLALGWPLPRSILLGFVISLGSTAVVLKVLQERQELDTEVGQDVTGVLLVQDLALVPMLIIINLLGGEAPGPGEVALQVAGGVALIGLIAWLMIKGSFQLPFARFLRSDPELEVFAAFLLCFGLALVTGLLGLSAAVGAFVAGIVVTAARETHWVHERLESFRVVFVALFFGSVGMLVDVAFFAENWGVIVLLAIVAMLTNMGINAVVMRGLGLSWRHSLYAGALLAQIGEFSFVLAAAGLEGGVIDAFGYQVTIGVIALTLLVSPAWFSFAKRLFVQGTSAPLPEPAGSGEPGE